ncbi:MAG: hypothetical protein ABEI86_08190 [Halobacteriaceae archaeon]
MWVEIGSAIFGGIGTLSAQKGYEWWREKNENLDNWYQQGISLASHGNGICDSAKQRSDLNYGKISKEAEKLSTRLDKHVNPHPNDADEKSVHQLSELSKIFSKLSAVTEVSSEKSTDESLGEIFEMSQRESRQSPDVDMSKAVEESTEYSPIMETLIGNIESGSRKFGQDFRSELEESNSLEELIETMSDELKVSENTLERKFEREFVGEDWDDSLSIAVRIHLQIASNLCQDTINYLSEVSGESAAKGPD